MKRKKYEYLVAYFYGDGVGSCCLEIDRKIASADDVAFVKRHIEMTYDLKNVGLVNIVLLRKKRDCR